MTQQPLKLTRIEWTKEAPEDLDKCLHIHQAIEWHAIDIKTQLAGDRYAEVYVPFSSPGNIKSNRLLK